MSRRALIIVDVQNDFLPGGKLAVKGGDEVISVINRIMKEQQFSMIVASKDWHPEDHSSFSQWPSHCVEKTAGAEINEDLEIWKYNHCIVKKGTMQSKEEYSAFCLNYVEEKLEASNDLAKTLFEEDIDEVYVCGLAAEYCVLETAKDSVKLGFKTYMIMDATKPVHIPLIDILEVVQASKIVPIYSNEI